MGKGGGRLKKTLLASTAYSKSKDRTKLHTTAKGSAAVAKPHPTPKLARKLANARPPYSHHQSILLVGEGNFSFANALLSTVYVQAPENMTATSFDSLDVVHEKYPDAEAFIENLTESGALVLHDVDASKLSKTKSLKGRKFDVIAFNFPHVGAGIKDQDRNIMENQKLIASFITSALAFLEPNGEIHIALKDSHPYTNWNIKMLAANQGLCLKSKTPFIPSMYPGYTHRRTIGFDERVSTDDNADLKRGSGEGGVGNCFTFVFWRLELAQKQSQKKGKDGNESD
ncbi:hypothetical protein BC830DRAFT_1117637 [Chytriomyces sp. MP71]|nr:hypothetical protein BC830DRAFT_1117637 [Chytriomyces sp. MP71]